MAKQGEKKFIAVMAAVLAVFLWAGCEYLNAPIQPFIDMNTAVVSLNTVNVGTQMEGTRYVEYNAAQEDYLIPIVLNNPQQFNIQAVVKSAVKNGDTASGVTVAGCTKNEVVVRISGAAQEDGYQITLRITSKDGVASGERTFDIPLPLIVFAALQDIVDPKVVFADGTAHVQVKILKDPENAPLKNVTIGFKYVDTVISPDPSTPVNPRPEPVMGVYNYAWEDSTSRLLLDGNPVDGFSAPLDNGYLAFDLPFPADFVSSHPAFDETTTLGCSFTITIEDELGATAVKTSPAFNRPHCNYKVEWDGIQYYRTLNDAMADVSSRGVATSAAAPDVIIVLEDLTHRGTINLNDSKYVLLTVPPNEGKTITLDDGHSGNVFEISGSLALRGANGNQLIVDGNKDNVDLVNTSLAVVNSGGLLDLGDHVVLRNAKTTGSGGPISVNAGGILKIEGGNITGMAGVQGGAVYVNGGVFNMLRGNIFGNEAVGATDEQGGGGVYVTGSTGAFTMTAGAIYGNHSTKHGGGVMVRNGTFTMESGAIFANRADGNGDGVYVGGTASFEMKGAASVTADSAVAANNNDVYLASGNTITITGDIGNGIPGWIAAKITLPAYTAGTRVLTDNTYLTPVNIARFAITDAAGYIQSTDGANKGCLSLGKAASRGGLGGMLYYGSLTDAVAAAVATVHATLGTSSYDPDVITVLGNITHLGTIPITIDNNKFIKLTVPYNESKTITLHTMHSVAVTIFQINNGSTLIFSGNGTGGELTFDGNAKELYFAWLVRVDAGGTLRLQNNAVLRNINTNQATPLIRVDGSFLMEGGKIADMKSTDGAVGLTGSSAVFTMSGGTIENNTHFTTGENIGVKVSAGTFNMTGSAVVNTNNSVALASGTTITIVGTLAGTAPVAKISLPSYTADTRVLAGTTFLTEANIMRFALANSTYYIQSGGANKGKITNVKNASRTVGATPTPTTLYYAAVKDAVDAASGTSSAPDVITVLEHINMASTDNITIPSGKYVKLISGATQRTLKRASGNTASLITVNGQLTLEDIIVDGGAVWNGGSLPAGEPRSPAFDATNVGLSALNTLVFVSGTAAKLTLDANAVLQNNCNTLNPSNPYNLGGGIRATGGAQVVIDGLGAAVRYNRASWVGGGIALHDNAPAGTKLTLINGSVDNNHITTHDGGGIATEYGIVEIRGGIITKNYAPTNNGGIHFSNCSATGQTGTISGGLITENKAGQNGGGIGIIDKWTITMTGGTISDNRATQAGGGVYMKGNAHLDMSGGTVSGNTAGTDGGGVAILEGSNTALAMSGTAAISSNTAVAFGGGIVIKNGSVAMDSGTITGNTGIGGGVFLCDDGGFTMNNGAITSNTSSGTGTGGGVRIGNNGTFTMNGGSITGNIANYGVGVRVDYLGGGIGMFIKRGGTIAGNTASSGTGIAVMAGNDTCSGTPDKYRDDDAGDGVRMYFYSNMMTDPSDGTDTSGAWLP